MTFNSTSLKSPLQQRHDILARTITSIANMVTVEEGDQDETEEAIGLGMGEIVEMAHDGMIADARNAIEACNKIPDFAPEPPGDGYPSDLGSVLARLKQSLSPDTYPYKGWRGRAPDNEPTLNRDLAIVLGTFKTLN